MKPPILRSYRGGILPSRLKPPRDSAVTLTAIRDHLTHLPGIFSCPGSCCHVTQGIRAFSIVPRMLKVTETESQMRQRMYAWLTGPGSQYRNPTPGHPNYLATSSEDPKARHPQPRSTMGKNSNSPGSYHHRQSTRPFPLNPHYISHPVLSEELREEIYAYVVERGWSVRRASVEFKVTMERVTAVVRMKTMEKEDIRRGRPLATKYSQAILSMLPTTPLVIDSSKGLMNQPIHEEINDLPVHPHTVHQMFYPVPESLPFTRADAGRAFNPDLLPADQRIPHPQLIAEVKERDLSDEELELAKANREAQENEKYVQKTVSEMHRRAAKTLVVRTPKVDFCFENINVDVNKRSDPRNHRGIGWRYGLPLNDRKKGVVKIPTRVGA